jgi:hypothetical protein
MELIELSDEVRTRSGSDRVTVLTLDLSVD